MATLIFAVTISIVVSAFCSLMESILYSTRDTVLEAADGPDKAPAEAMKLLRGEVEKPLAAILIINTAANTAGASLAGWAAAEVWGPGSLWLFSLGFTLGILIFSEIVPKTVGAVYWPGLWAHMVLPLKVMVRITTPLIVLTRSLTGLITKGRSEQHQVSEDEILAAARLGADGGEISKLEHDLIANIIKLEDIKASDIMTPRTVIFSQDASTPIIEASGQARDWIFTRVPVVAEGPEDVVGYVIRDQVMAAGAAGDKRPVGELAQPVRYVPASANALDLLNSLLARREHIYMIVDEYGGIMGLVTLEDVLETLVGSEIVDEKDVVVDMQDLARKRGKGVLDSE